MTMLVKRNMTWVRDSAKLRMGFCRVSETRVRAMAKRMAKTATCRIWFSATDLTIFSGKMCRMKSVQWSGATSGTGWAEVVAGVNKASPEFVGVMGERPKKKKEGAEGLRRNKIFQTS